MKILAVNKFARSDYEILDTYDVGIVLAGHEVKSAKTSTVQIKDAIIKVIDQELRITNMDISLYKKTDPQSVKGYDPKGMRKLLVSKKELAKIAAKTTKTGLIIIPLKLYENAHRFLKIELGIARLLKKVEKKQILKEKDQDREMQRTIKNIVFR